MVLPRTKTAEQCKQIKLVDMRKMYLTLAEVYDKILNHDLIYCPVADEFLSKSNFYQSKEYIMGKFPISKGALSKIAEPPGSDKLSEQERKANVQKVLKMMNLPYMEKVYDAAKRLVEDKKAVSVFGQYMSMILTLPNYRDLEWKDSSFGNFDSDVTNEDNQSQDMLKRAAKRFGPGFMDSEYLFLETQYEDWVSRYECETKAQEEIFERLSFKKLEILKATKEGAKTNDLDKSYMDLLSSINILPRQGKAAQDESANPQMIVGNLIKDWEQTKPVPKTQYEDIDGYGKTTREWYLGPICDTFGLKNQYDEEYREAIAAYTVERTDDTDEETNDDIYDKLFGRGEE